MRARMHMQAQIRPPPAPLAGGEEVVQVSRALPGLDALYLPLMATVAKKTHPTQMGVLDAYVAKLDKLLTVGVGSRKVQTRIHE